MESLLLLIDCAAIILVVYWYARNETRKPGEPVGGLLRYREVPRSGQSPTAKPKPRPGLR